jgi:hypothetical protein
MAQRSLGDRGDRLTGDDTATVAAHDSGFPVRRLAKRWGSVTSIGPTAGQKQTVSLGPRECVSRPRHRAAAEGRLTAQGEQSTLAPPPTDRTARLGPVRRDGSVLWSGLPSRSSRSKTASRTGAKAGVPDGTRGSVGPRNPAHRICLSRGVKAQATRREPARCRLSDCRLPAPRPRLSASVHLLVLEIWDGSHNNQ